MRQAGCDVAHAFACELQERLSSRRFAIPTELAQEFAQAAAGSTLILRASSGGFLAAGPRSQLNLPFDRENGVNCGDARSFASQHAEPESSANSQARMPALRNARHPCLRVRLGNFPAAGHAQLCVANRQNAMSCPVKPAPSQANPDKLLSGFHSRGTLPHIKREGGSYFVTFRLAGTLPKFKAGRGRNPKHALAASTLAQQWEELFRWYASRVDKYLDAGHGACWMRQPEIADLVANAGLINFRQSPHQFYQSSASMVCHAQSRMRWCCVAAGWALEPTSKRLERLYRPRSQQNFKTHRESVLAKGVLQSSYTRR